MKSSARALMQHFAVLMLGGGLASDLFATEPSSPPTPAQTEAGQALQNLNEEWTVAEQSHDAATLRRILDDRFVATFGAGRTIALFAGGEVDRSASHTVSYDAVIIDGDTYTARGRKPISDLAQTRAPAGTIESLEIRSKYKI